jgi:hypothetical protein
MKIQFGVSPQLCDFFDTSHQSLAKLLSTIFFVHTEIAQIWPQIPANVIHTNEGS